MDIREAARVQYRRNSFYVVFLVGPGGERERLGSTQRKSGAGLLNLLYKPSVQERIKLLPGVENARLTKHKDRLEFSNGWRMEFGGTIREEAIQ